MSTYKAHMMSYFHVYVLIKFQVQLAGSIGATTMKPPRTTPSLLPLLRAPGRSSFPFCISLILLFITTPITITTPSHIFPSQTPHLAHHPHPLPPPAMVVQSLLSTLYFTPHTHSSYDCNCYRTQLRLPPEVKLARLSRAVEL